MGHGFAGSEVDVEQALAGALRTWERSRREDHVGAGPPQAVQPFVTISRQVGAGGSDLAARISQRTGWALFDREILQAMAGDDSLRERLYAWMDERDISWLEGALAWIAAGKWAPHDYFPRLSRNVLALARGASAIFVGRGADLILPPGIGLRLRVIAPLEQRLESFAQRHGLDQATARREVERIDRGRSEFIQRHFHCDVDSVERHDLVLNMGRLSAEDALEVSMCALRLRGMIPT